MLALYARRYESEPFARPLSLAEVAAAARLSPDRARLALLRRIRAGWVEEEIPGRYQLRGDPTEPPEPGPVPEINGQEGNGSRRPAGASEPKPPDDLVAAWIQYLEPGEFRIVQELLRKTWKQGRGEAPLTFTRLVRDHHRESPIDAWRVDERQFRCWLDRLLLMRVVWRIVKPGQSPSAPPTYRLNPRWHWRLREL